MMSSEESDGTDVMIRKTSTVAFIQGDRFLSKR